jgi:hypothetical protein
MIATREIMVVVTPGGFMDRVSRAEPRGTR